jgi:hypothetical protein
VARASEPLDTGASFPELTFDTVAHGRIALPAALAGRWGLVLVYRAHW